MSVKLRKRKNADGTISLRLDIYHDGQRWVETLKHLQLSKSSTVLDRENNKQRLKLAESIAVARAAELEAGNYGLIAETARKTLAAAWMQSYANSYQKADKRVIQGVLGRFVDFLTEHKKQGLTFGQLSPTLVEDFMEYLENGCAGEGAASYFKRFKKMVKQAYRKNLMKENPLDKVERKIKGKAVKKDVLTLAEIQTLAATHTESPEVRRAFLFSCVTGLRWCDVKALQWKDINLKEKRMAIRQDKTGEDVSIELNDTALKLLGKPATGTVFTLPSPTGANKTVKAWVKRASITKKITWHNARHSFGTNLIFNDVDVLTASKLLGHTTMKHTQRYVNAAEEMKRRATDKINIQI